MDRGKEVLANALNDLIGAADTMGTAFAEYAKDAAKAALEEADSPIVEPVDCIVPMSEPVLSLLRCLLDAQVAALYDDPNGFAVDETSRDLAERVKIGVRMEMAQLKAACLTLRMDWKETVLTNATDFEISRMCEITGEVNGY